MPTIIAKLLSELTPDIDRALEGGPFDEEILQHLEAHIPQIDDQRVLTLIALNLGFSARIASLKSLSISTDTLGFDLVDDLKSRITLPHLIIKIALTAREPVIQKAFIKKVTDSKILLLIYSTTSDISTKGLCLSQLKPDQSLIKSLLEKEIEPTCRIDLLSLMNDQTELEKLLMKSSLSSTFEIRALAYHIRSEKVLKKFLTVNSARLLDILILAEFSQQSDLIDALTRVFNKIHDQKFLKSMYKKFRSQVHLVYNILDSITDQSFLLREAGNLKNNQDLRTACLFHLKDSQILGRIIGSDSVQTSIKTRLIDQVEDENLLSLLAAGDHPEEVREAIQKRLTELDALRKGTI